MKMNELIKVENLVPENIFVEGGTAPFKVTVGKAVEEFVVDISTETGRKELKRFGKLFNKSRNLVDDAGKDLKAKHAAIIKPIDAERKRFRDWMDAKRDEVLQPLSEWEAEQAEIERKRMLEIEVEMDWDAALIEDETFNRERELKRKEAEFAKREAKMQAEEDARLAKIEADRLEKEKVEREASLQKEAAEQARIKAEAEAKQRIIDAENEKKRLEAEAIAAEAKRLNDIKIAEAARQANTEHRRTINNEIMSALLALHINEAKAKEIIVSIATGVIPHLEIKY
jgi:colicin import membrane protein